MVYEKGFVVSLKAKKDKKGYKDISYKVNPTFCEDIFNGLLLWLMALLGGCLMRESIE